MARVTWKEAKRRVRGFGTQPQFLLLTFILLFSGCLYAESQKLNFWLIPNELPLETLPPFSKRRLFFRNLPEYLNHQYPEEKIDISSSIHVVDISSQLEGDSVFAKWVLGQKQIFKELDNFIDSTDFDGEIWLKFFKWEQYLSSLLVTPSSLDPPDIVQVPTSWLALLADKKIISELPNNVAKSADRHYVKSSLKTCRKFSDGKLFGLPWLIDLRLLFYYRDLFPNPEINLRNRETFEQVLTEVSNQAYLAMFVLPTAIDWDLLHQTILFIWGYGEDVIRIWRIWKIILLKKILFDKKENVEAIRFLLGLSKAGYLALPRKDRYCLEEDFLNRKYGSMVSGPWLIKGAFRKFGEHWDEKIGVALPPVGLGSQKLTFLGGSNLSVSQMSSGRANYHVALSLIGFLSRSPSSFRYTRATGHLPSFNESLGNVQDALSDRNSLRSGERIPENYMEYLVSITTNDFVIKVVDDALSLGRSYPSISEWAARIEVPTTRIGLYHLWQDIAGHESQKVIEADLKHLAKEINKDLFWKPLMIWIVVSLVVFVGLSLTVYAFLSRSRFRELSHQVKEKIDEIAKIERKKADLEGKKNQIQNNLEKLEQEMGRKEKDIEKFRHKEAIVSEEFSKKMKELETIRNRIESLRTEVCEKEKEIKYRDDLISKLEDEKERLIKIIERQFQSSIEVSTGPLEKPKIGINFEEMRALAEKGWKEYRNLQKGQTDDEGMVKLPEKMIVYRKKGPFEKVISDILNYSQRDAYVLITGDSGTGKELVAEAIHFNSKKNKPFRPVTCTAIPENLLMGELFGSCEGAYTGAPEREGAIEQVGDGILFLDEIGDMSYSAQGSLLRALRERFFQRLGGRKHTPRDGCGQGNADHRKPIEVKARIIAATNVDLEKAKKSGKFRTDLYYRINKLRILLPPLSERKGDIPYLINHITTCYAERNRVDKLKFSEDAVKAMMCYDWPGNVAELENFVERAYTLGKSVIGLADLENVFGELKDTYELVYVKQIIKLINDLVREIEPKFDNLLSQLCQQSDAMKYLIDQSLKSLGAPGKLYQWLVNRSGKVPSQRKMTARMIIIILYEKLDKFIKHIARGRRTDLRESICREFFGRRRKTIEKWRKSEEVQKFLSDRSKSKVG